MLKQTLQNYSGSKEYPPQPEWKLVLKAIKSPYWIHSITLFLLFLYCASIIYYATFSLIVKASIWGITLLILFIAVYFINNIMKKNITAQLKYYEINNIQELSSEQAQALQLCLCIDYNWGRWNETLEYYPLLEKIEELDFIGIVVTSIENERYHLYNSFEILLTEEYHSLIGRIFSEGLFTAKFLHKYVFPENGMKRLARLSSISIQEIGRYIQPNEINERKLIWGYEFFNVIFITRQAYMAQLISEDVAWENILKASSYIHTLFDNFDDFYLNYILGNVVSFESMEKANDRWSEYIEYKNYCQWRFKNLNWQKQSVELPEIVSTVYSIAFDDFYQDEEDQDDKLKQKIGFI